MPKVLSTSTFVLLVQTQAESRCHPLVLDLSHCGWWTDSTHRETPHVPGKWQLKVKRYSSLWETYLRATGPHLPYGITQCYLPPNTGKRALHNHSQKGWYSIYLHQRDWRLSWPRWLVTYGVVYPSANGHPSINWGRHRVTMLIETNARPPPTFNVVNVMCNAQSDWHTIRVSLHRHPSIPDTTKIC